MNEITSDDLFKTTFGCPVIHSAEHHSTREEAVVHNLGVHVLDDPPMLDYLMESLDELPDSKIVADSSVQDTLYSDYFLSPTMEDATQYFLTSDSEFLDDGISNISEVDDEYSQELLEQNKDNGLNLLLSGQRTNNEILSNNFKKVDTEWSFDYESESTSQGALIDDMGDVEMIVQNIKDEGRKWLTCYSPSNQSYHVKSGRDGNFSITLRYNNIEIHPDGEYFVRSMLIRSSEAYRHFPVNRVCEKHQGTIDGIDQEMNIIQPLQALPGSSAKEYFYSHLGVRPSFIYKCKAPDVNGTIIANPKMIFLCNDSCSNSSYSQHYKNAEAARSLYLVQTLEVKKLGVVKVLARSKVSVWPKASVCDRDLLKTERRKPKGAAAQKASRLKRLNNEAIETTESKKIKSEPINTEYHIEELVKTILEGQLTADEIGLKIRQKLKGKSK
eukprot:GFUD01000808.1.p1 GENE.GFUD01000808.1~~GFUD01000808.1.p1  ORF type:complete len:443 (+),score=87.48 GFUD01000808.1:114-1442(+)